MVTMMRYYGQERPCLTEFAPVLGRHLGLQDLDRYVTQVNYQAMQSIRGDPYHPLIEERKKNVDHFLAGLETTCPCESEECQGSDNFVLTPLCQKII